jgi:hypothetical protein
MNWLIDYLLKHAWPLAIVALLLSINGLQYISGLHKESVIAGLKAQNVEQYIALQQAESVAQEEKRLNTINTKKADEYRALALAQQEEIKRSEVPENCEKAKDWVIESLNPSTA